MPGTAPAEVPCALGNGSSPQRGDQFVQLVRDGLQLGLRRGISQLMIEDFRVPICGKASVWKAAGGRFYDKFPTTNQKSAIGNRQCLIAGAP
jgi:hypothetical protein